MKKTLTLLASAAMMAGLFSSCDPCVECTLPEEEVTMMGITTTIPEQSTEFCKSDADSRKEYKDAIDDLESAGWTCNKK